MERAALAFALLVVAATVLGAGGTATRANATQAQAPVDLAATQDFDRTEFRITVYNNGSARWTFVFTEFLENESEREDFRAFAADFNNNETQLYTDFQDRAGRLTAQASNETGREMEATAFSKQAGIDDINPDLGVVRMSFIWTNCAVIDGDRVVLSDVFDGGLYVGPNQRLVVERGPELAFRSVDPGADNVSGERLAASDSVTWLGERSFSDERPQIVLGPPQPGTSSPAGPGTTDTSPDAQTDSPTLPGTGGGFGGWPLLVLALLVLGGLTAFAFRSGALGGPQSTPTGGDNDGSSGVAATNTTAGSEVDPDPAVSDEELLSDEDRVLQMLEERGGRMKQVNIVEETGWSKSKVSMLLSDMEEEDKISKLRIGRENVISLPGEEPDAAGSPFDEEE